MSGEYNGHWEAPLVRSVESRHSVLYRESSVLKGESRWGGCGVAVAAGRVLAGGVTRRLAPRPLHSTHEQLQLRPTTSSSLSLEA